MKTEEEEEEQGAPRVGEHVQELIPQKRGEGAYGCYYYPRVPCDRLTAEQMRRIDEAEVLGSKVQAKSRLLDRELAHIKRLVERVPEHHLYFVVPKRVCGLDEERHVSDCEQLMEHKGRRRRHRHRDRDRRNRKRSRGGLGAEPKAPSPCGGRKGCLGLGGGAAASTSARGEELDLMSFDYDRSSRWVNMLMTNVEHRVSLHAYLRSLPHTERWSGLLHMYKHLTQATLYLKGVGLVHWDMHLENVLVDARTGVPYIIDFGLSVDATDATERRDFARFGVKPRFYRWTFETQFLMWGGLGGEDEAGGATGAVVDALVDHARFFDICSVEFRRRYVRGAKAFYAGLTKAHARSDLLWLGWPTWDTYSLAVLFLQFICSMYSSGFHVNNRMLRGLLKLLLDSVHYDWRRRPSSEATLERINGLLERSYERSEMELSREYPTFLDAQGCPEP